MTGNPFDTIYIPTEDDYDEYNSGNKTLEQLHKEFATRTVVAVVEDATDPVPVEPEQPIVRGQIYKEAGSKDKLKAIVETTEVLVAKDINATTGAKGFKIINWKKWLESTKRYDMNEYECLRGSVYPYMDIESEQEDIDVIEMLNSSIGCYADALLASGVEIISIAIANSSRPGKHSFHVIFKTNKVFESTITQHYFIQSHVKPHFVRNSNTVWSRINKKTQQTEIIDCVDWKVYTTDRVIRFLNQSKMGKTVRLTPYSNDALILPCLIDNSSVAFLIGHYGQVEPLSTIAVEVPEHIKKIKEAKEQGVIQPTIEVPASYLNDLAALVSNEVIQNGGTCCRFIWAMVRSGASRELVHKHASRTDNYDPKWVDYHIAHANTMNVNIGTLRYWAYQNNKQAAHALAKQYQTDEITKEIHTFTTSLPIVQYSERYVRPFSLQDCDTLLVKAHLGTGKTTQIVNIIKPVYSEFLETEVAPYNRILIVSGRKSFTRFIDGDLAECGLGFKSYDEKHFGPLSNVDRLIIQVESLWRLEDSFEKYDLVVIDESETIAHQFYSEATHRHNMKKNHILFERCVSTAKKVIFADAFLSNRTLSLAEALRNPAHCQVIENTFCPYKRTATELVSINKKGKKVPALAAFCNGIMDDLKAGKKVVVIWGSKSKGKAFTEMFLKESNYKWRFYSSESNADEHAELQNVEKAWKNIDCLNYTSTITVGINYNPEELADCFDKIYLYGSAAGGLPRDIAQALLRCRRLKENQLVYIVNDKTVRSALYGRDTIRDAIQQKRTTLLTAHTVLNWENAPKWAENNYIENENENGAKCIAFREILNGYLVKSGYTLNKRVVRANEAFKLECADIEFDDIEDITEDEADLIQKKAKGGFASFEEKVCLQKFRFCSQLTTRDPAILVRLWDEFMKNKGTEGYFWNQVNEKHQTTREYLEHESKQRFIQNASKKCQKRIVLDKLLSVLKIKTTADAFKIDNLDQFMEALTSLESEVFEAFEVHDGSRRKGEFKTANAVDMLKMVWTSWTGRTIKTTRQRKGAGGKVIVWAIKNVPSTVWEHITPRVEIVAEETPKPSGLIQTTLPFLSV